VSAFTAAADVLYNDSVTALQVASSNKNMSQTENFSACLQTLG
jgi:hypothetical protein